MLRFKLHHLFAYSLLITTLCHRPAQAVGVNFDLDGNAKTISTSQSPSSDTDSPTLFEPELDSSTEDFKPLPIPAAASQPPIRVTQSSSHLPNNVILSVRVLTPPPAAALPTSRILEPIARSPQPAPIALSFTPPGQETASLSTSPLPDEAPDRLETKAPEVSANTALPSWIYEGGSDSLVARVVGSAEGTRAANGHRTQAYYGHTDPGNGVWNMGTFSYQHGASSPQEADKKQLKRLKKQGKSIVQQADQADLTMSLGEVLNGLDLANQSPRAALEHGGYVDRLVQARKKGMHNSDAIIWARTYSYLDPETQRWNAPGLGNTLTSIRRDQNRRHDAIARAFNYYQAQNFNPDQSPEKILNTPVLALAKPSLGAVTSEDTYQNKQKIDSINTAPSSPLAFSVNASSYSAIQTNEDTQKPTSAVPELQAEASKLDITDDKPGNTPQMQISSDPAHGDQPVSETDKIPG